MENDEREINANENQMQWAYSRTEKPFDIHRCAHKNVIGILNK